MINTNLNITLKIQKAINSKNAIRDKFQLGNIAFADYADAINVSSTPSASTELNFYKCVKVGNIAYNITITESNFESLNNRTFDFYAWSDTTTLKSRIWSTQFDTYRFGNHIKNFDNLWYIVQTDERYRY